MEDKEDEFSLLPDATSASRKMKKTWASRKSVFLCSAIFLIVIVLFLQSREYDSSFASRSFSRMNPFVEQTYEKSTKFIGSTYSSCSGLGNQMYRMASLYGIGRHFGRTPFLHAALPCHTKMLAEFEEVFPNMAHILEIVRPNASEIAYTDFALDCCKYDNPENFHDVPQKFLILRGNFLQSYKYFDKFAADIRYLFDFSEPLKERVEEAGAKLFGNDSSHKMCVHIRRGDFIAHAQLESRADFVVPAMERIRLELAKLDIVDISVVFLGTDKTFMRRLNYTKEVYNNIYYPSMKSRGEDLYFGSQFCDSMFISASGSTFAFWMAYLMAPEAPVFYNGQVSVKRQYNKDYFDYDMFPHHWTMLEYNAMNKSVSVDNRWFYEKFGRPRALFSAVHRRRKRSFLGWF